MGKALSTIVILALVVLGGLWIANRDDGFLAGDGNPAATSTDLFGTGGPDEGFDPLEGTSDDEEDVQDKG